MTDQPFLAPDADREAALDAATVLLGLRVETAWRPEVVAHMKVIAEAARLILDFELEDEIEPAPVYRP
jgi:hypothetical protein